MLLLDGVAGGKILTPENAADLSRSTGSPALPTDSLP
jgi:hypothetical protein